MKKIPHWYILVWKWYPFIYLATWKVYPVQPHVCIYLYNGSNTPPPVWSRQNILLCVHYTLTFEIQPRLEVIINLWEMNNNIQIQLTRVSSGMNFGYVCTATLTLRSGQTLMPWTTILLGLVSISAYQTAYKTQTGIRTQVFSFSRNALPLSYLDVFVCLIAKIDKTLILFTISCTERPWPWL